MTTLPAVRGRDAHIEQLGKVPMFSGASRKELGLVAQAGDEIQIPAGQVLMEEGRQGHEFFLILEGDAVVKRRGKKVANLGPGQYFGELALLHRGPRSATVTAESDLVVLVLAQREFSGVLDAVPALGRTMLASMARRLREADTQTRG